MWEPTSVSPTTEHSDLDNRFTPSLCRRAAHCSSVSASLAGVPPQPLVKDVGSTHPAGRPRLVERRRRGQPIVWVVFACPCHPVPVSITNHTFCELLPVVSRQCKPPQLRSIPVPQGNSHPWCASGCHSISSNTGRRRRGQPRMAVSLGVEKPRGFHEALVSRR